MKKLFKPSIVIGKKLGVLVGILSLYCFHSILHSGVKNIYVGKQVKQLQE